MRASTHDDCITSKIADRLIARLAAQHGLRWPAAAPAAARRQPDLLHAEVIKNIDPDEIENLGRELILWRLQDLIRGLKYAHGMELHKTAVSALELESEALDFLAAALGAPNAADEIRRRGLALARAAMEKGIVH
jgi:hypothetical protein